MIKFDYRNIRAEVIGEENGLNIETDFEEYKERITQIINDLYQNKDERDAGKKWMNLGYDEDTLWYINEFAAEVKDKYENIVISKIRY